MKFNNIQNDKTRLLGEQAGSLQVQTEPIGTSRLLNLLSEYINERALIENKARE